MTIRNLWLGLLASLVAVIAATIPAAAQQQQKPNILFIMPDDVGLMNVSAYHRGTSKASLHKALHKAKGFQENLTK